MSDPKQALQLARAIIDVMTVGSCNCMTKTHEAMYHATDCPYRRASEVGSFIDVALAGLPAAAPTTDMAAMFAKWQQSSHIQLCAGDMKAGELRAVKAVVAVIEREVLAALASPAPAAASSVEPVAWVDANVLRWISDPYRAPESYVEAPLHRSADELKLRVPLFSSPLGGEPRQQTWWTMCTCGQPWTLNTVHREHSPCWLAPEPKDGLVHLAAPQSSRTSVEAPANAPSAEGSL